MIEKLLRFFRPHLRLRAACAQVKLLLTKASRDCLDPSSGGFKVRS
jgi:hypothetical protein